MPGFEAYTQFSAEGGFELRDSANVTLTNSMLYGNGADGITVQGVAGGIPYIDW
jgi:parallel beta-helix repeat protein